MDTIHLTAHELGSLVRAVLPFAGTDDMLPVINSVLIESDGKWLYAMTTDRFRIGVKRIAKRPTDEDESTAWPSFRALVPLRSMKALLALFKPSRGFDPTLSLSVDGDQLTAEATGGFDLFTSSRFSYTLLAGEFPDMRLIVRKATASPASERVTTLGLNPKFLADFAHLSRFGSALEFTMPAAEKDPVVIRDNDGFIGLLMPRRLMSSGDDVRESWADFTDPKEAAAAELPPPAKKPAPRKRAAKKQAVPA